MVMYKFRLLSGSHTQAEPVFENGKPLWQCVNADCPTWAATERTNCPTCKRPAVSQVKRPRRYYGPRKGEDGKIKEGQVFESPSDLAAIFNRGDDVMFMKYSPVKDETPALAYGFQSNGSDIGPAKKHISRNAQQVQPV